MHARARAKKKKPRIYPARGEKRKAAGSSEKREKQRAMLALRELVCKCAREMKRWGEKEHFMPLAQLREREREREARAAALTSSGPHRARGVSKCFLFFLFFFFSFSFRIIHTTEDFFVMRVFPPEFPARGLLPASGWWLVNRCWRRAGVIGFDY